MTTRTSQEESARALGLRLIEVSRVYEDVIVPEGAGAGSLAMVGLVARQRRMLRAAYLLADAGMRLEAGMFVRAGLEYLVMQKWLVLNPRLHHVLWVKNDLESRLRIARELGEGAPKEHEEALELLDPQTREQYEQSLKEMQAQVVMAQEELGLDRPPPFPNLKDRAGATDLAFAYSMAYRYESQVGVHPTPMAIEVLMGEDPAGVRLMSEPSPEQGYADPYAVAAFLLRDALMAAAEVAPELRLDGLDEIVAEMETVAKPG